MPDLQKHLDTIIQRGTSLAQSLQIFRDDDYYGYMLRLFLYVQIEHARSIHMLVEKKRYTDAGNLARLMIEGTVILKWVAEEPQMRVRRWIEYSHVENWRRLKSQQESGERIDPKLQESLEERLRRMGTQFIPQGKRRLEAEIQEDLFQKTWLVDDNGYRVSLSKLIVDSEKNWGRPTL